MATKPNNSPANPFVAIPYDVDEVELLFTQAVPCSDLASAQEEARRMVAGGRKAVIFQATHIYGEVTKTDILWKWGGNS